MNIYCDLYNYLIEYNKQGYITLISTGPKLFLPLTFLQKIYTHNDITVKIYFMNWIIKLLDNPKLDVYVDTPKLEDITYNSLTMQNTETHIFPVDKTKIDINIEVKSKTLCFLIKEKGVFNSKYKKINHIKINERDISAEYMTCVNPFMYLQNMPKNPGFYTYSFLQPPNKNYNIIIYPNGDDLEYKEYELVVLLV